jgi:hypothetical protein
MLARVVVELPHGRAKTLAELVDGWAAHVDRLYEERNRDLVQAPMAWGAHDYLAALSLRSMVASALERQDADIRQIANAVVRPADDKFISFTERDLGRVVERFAGQSHDDSAWWWHRLPVSGPVRAELLPVANG